MYIPSTLLVPPSVEPYSSSIRTTTFTAFHQTSTSSSPASLSLPLPPSLPPPPPTHFSSQLPPSFSQSTFTAAQLSQDFLHFLLPPASSPSVQTIIMPISPQQQPQHLTPPRSSPSPSLLCSAINLQNVLDASPERLFTHFPHPHLGPPFHERPPHPSRSPNSLGLILDPHPHTIEHPQPFSPVRVHHPLLKDEEEEEEEDPVYEPPSPDFNSHLPLSPKLDQYGFHPISPIFNLSLLLAPRPLHFPPSPRLLNHSRKRRRDENGSDSERYPKFFSQALDQDQEQIIKECHHLNPSLDWMNLENQNQEGNPRRKISRIDSS